MNGAVNSLTMVVHDERDQDGRAWLTMANLVLSLRRFLLPDDGTAQSSPLIVMPKCPKEVRCRHSRLERPGRARSAWRSAESQRIAIGSCDALS